MNRFPTILAIDTSCDDTAVAVTQGVRVLSNIVASQVEIHRIYGGVYPLAAKLAHHELINPTYKEALKRARIQPDEIDAVAVTQGPGLAIALEVGLEFAKELSKELKKPLIAVNHMAGHLYSPLAVNSKGNPKPNNPHGSFAPISLEKGEVYNFFPALALLVSGGHTELILLSSFTEYRKIGQTVDDAAGEALDKFARLLDLGYPGAAAMEELAKRGDPKAYQFPLPMAQTKDLSFSFSGLKTAGRQLIDRLGSLNAQDVSNLAASFQYAVFRALTHKLKKAIEQSHPRSLWLGGGVSANKTLRHELRKIAEQNQIQFLYPKLKRLHGDNAAMIGIAAYFKFSEYNSFPAENDLSGMHRQPRMSL